MVNNDRKTVLIVDDEEDMIWSLQKNLPTKDLKIEILTASSGEDALSMLKEAKIDLIVTDIRMPGISGTDLLIVVKNKYPDIGVIVMTAFPSSESKSEAIGKGALSFIEKPFDINEIRSVIRNAFQKDSHFEGKMTGIQLTDFIQINSLSKASTALLINAEGREGVIYFSDGNIVHATCGDLVGEEAFYELINFKGGTIETFYPETKPDTTITTPVDALLLQGTLWADEHNENVDLMNELDPGQQLTSESIDDDEVLFRQNGTEPDTKTDDLFHSVRLNEEKEITMDELKKLLSEFTNIPGVNTACLVGRDGFLLNSVTVAGTDSEMVGAIAASGFGASEAMGRQLEKGVMSMTMVEYNNGPIMLSPIGSEAFLVIIADKDANLGMIRLKIKKHSKEIEQTSGI